MKIKVNNEETEIAEKATVSVLVKQLNVPLAGIAIAINNSIVSKVKWEQTTLNSNDNITLIRAAQGG
jgi:sulfur carrier protein